VYEIDPLLCPYCGTAMKIIAFITEHATVVHILEHMRMPAQRPEPLAHSAPLQGGVALRVVRPKSPAARATCVRGRRAEARFAGVTTLFRG
jgi:hypothetical protein